MRWWLWPLWRLRVVLVPVLLVPVLLPATEQRGRLEQRRRVRQQRTAVLVATRFVRVVHACRGAALTPARQSVETRAPLPDPRDVFLCHAWDDRQGTAKELHDLLVSRGVSVWFSEKDVALGTPLLREIDKGLAKSRVGIVLVTPALLRRVQREGIADKELSALLARDLPVPIVHGTTYEALREVSPLLGSRSGLSIAEEQTNVAAKIAELVTL
jgi:hypothetical protein